MRSRVESDATAEARHRAAIALLERREFDAARAALADADLDGRPAIALHRAQADWGAGFYASALARFAEASARPDASPEAIVRHAQALAASGAVARAAALLEQRQAELGDDPHAALLAGLYALDTSSAAHVLQHFEALAAAWPGAGEIVVAADALSVFARRAPAEPRDYGRANANARWRTVLDQARHVPPARLCGTAAGVLATALAACSVEGLVAEFGVHHGRSLALILAATDGPVHGFDSFEGLPADWTQNDRRGAYATGGRMPELGPRAVLHRGWFARTLPAFASAHTGPLRFVHVDCDLYESTRTVFDALGDRLVPGSVLVFDDYFALADDGERRAFAECVARHGLRYEYLAFALLGREAAVRITAVGAIP